MSDDHARIPKIGVASGHDPADGAIISLVLWGQEPLYSSEVCVYKEKSVLRELPYDQAAVCG